MKGDNHVGYRVLTTSGGLAMNMTTIERLGASVVAALVIFTAWLGVLTLLAELID